MTLTLPPSYVPLPVDVIEQVYEPDKPHRVLFASYVRLLALAWQNKYEHTPRLREEELYNTFNADGSIRYGFLKLSRREYFTQKREMELLGWLRSTRPAAGFVQFTFARKSAALDPGDAENRTGGAENRTDDLKRIHEEDSDSLNSKESSSSLTATSVRKTALTAEERKIQLFVTNMRLLFDPETHGVLEMREAFLAAQPQRALGWIAKAYQDRKRLANPIGLIVKHLQEGDAPDAHYLENARQILPCDFLEAVEEIQYACEICASTFGKHSELEAHLATHPDRFRCSVCEQVFDQEIDLDAHYCEEHAPKPFRVDESAQVPIDGSLTAEQAWQSVLGQLQMEVPRASFDTWVRDTKAIRYGGNTLEIGVRSAYARDWLESRLESTVSRLLVGILRRSVNVEFVTE